MEKLDLKTTTWLWDHVIPKLAVLFNEPSDHVECKVTKPKGCFYMSDIFFVSLRFSSGDKRKVLVKRPCENSVQINSEKFEKLFDNEILFYQKVATEAKKREYPTYYLGGPDPIYGRFIAMEDVGPRGYFPSNIKINLPLDYVIESLKSIARFHGNTYTLKARSLKNFNDTANKIIKIRYDDVLNEKFRDGCNKVVSHVTRSLRARDDDSEFTEKIAKLFEDSLSNVLMKCVKSVEPLATICHGDCTVNNILFRLQEDDEGSVDEKLKAMLIDFSLVMYSSPATDVSTFIYLSCSSEDIKYSTADLFKVYHDTLIEYLKDHKVQNLEKYSYDTFWEDYKRCALFGYTIAAFFLPTMVELEKNSDLSNLDPDETHNCVVYDCGEALSNTLVDMLIDMREDGLLDSWL